MYRRTLGRALVILLSFVAEYAIAESSPGHRSVTLDEVLARALNESPLVSRLEASIATERATGVRIQTLDNPIVDSEIRFPTSYKNTRGADEIAVSISQPLRASDFGSRGRVNRLLQSAIDEERKIELLVFSQKVKLAYIKTWALERRERELSKNRDTAERIERAIRRAAEGGLLGSSEGLLFKAEVQKSRLELGAIGSDLARARAELRKVAGFSVQGALEKPALTEPPSFEQLKGGHSVLPVQGRAKLALTLAREQERQAELDAYPRFAPRLVYERTNDYTEFFGVGFSIELPLFDRNQGERLARSAEARAAERNFAYLAGEGYDEEVSSILAGLRSSTAYLQGYEREILPTLTRALDAEENLFASGKGAPTRLWQVLRELSAAQTEVLERLVKLYADRVELVTVTGTDF